ncbi:hypothetical protein [Pseudomonas gingeri]|uniref:hypothetical protein n=1 Tax=Pseudomonas gingeri TaxID=117681 RepID=UPI0015BFE839|nr:hypothetical protein [Pseudomonas gingeri]NWD49009.1 hypothetical protein [Pseudomonas gingeri]
MAQRFMTLVAGARKLIEALTISAGAADAGRIPATGADGRLHSSLMPVGIGTSTTLATASEAIGAGKYVQFHEAAGVFSIRLADNSNGRFADGFVLEAVAASAMGTVYPLDSVNTALTGLVDGGRYYLGIAGAVIADPLDETAAGNVNKVSQYLGVAKSPTELVTTDDGYVVL